MGIEYITRTETRWVRRSEKTLFAFCAERCSLARKMKNCATFKLRQDLFEGKTCLIRSKMTDYLKADEYRKKIYEALGSAAAQWIAYSALNDFRYYFKALKAYKANPDSFTGKPKLPGYKKKHRTYRVSYNGFRIKQGRLFLGGIKEDDMPVIKVRHCQNQKSNPPKEEVFYSEVRIVPKGNAFKIELVYRVPAEYKKLALAVALNKNQAMAIDLGLDNIASCITTVPGVAPIIFKGGVLKAINKSYNQRVAKLRKSEDTAEKKGKKKRNNDIHIRDVASKRNRQIDDLLQKISHAIIQYCLAFDLGTIIIGKNKNWKQNANMGKVNNQKFVQIPHARLIDMIEYKAEEYGIKVIKTEESYTSKASALDFDPMPEYGKEGKVKPVFSGKRVKRGLYRTKDGRMINADLQAAINIARKVLGDQWLKDLLTADMGLLDRPVVIRNLHESISCGRLLKSGLRA